MKLFACMCNKPERLPAALAPVRAALVAAPPVSRWGLGYIQGGDVLLVRTPKASTTPVDLAGPLVAADIRSDCAIAQAVRDRPDQGWSGTDNTPPFRFRRWMFAQTGSPRFTEDVTARLLEHIPEYLRRNIKGRTPSELVFHLFLAMLHDEGNIDDPNLPTHATQRALAATLRLVTAETARVSDAAVTGSDALPALGNVALSNGRSMVLAQLGEPLRLRRLWVTGERGERDEAFRGVLLVSGGDGDPRDGFEDVPAQRAVLISRELHVSLAELAP
ncbi:MAG: class II glutamine amidotransferase [Kofleriaceae bacterium]